jgi:hypothetical protein
MVAFRGQAAHRESANRRRRPRLAAAHSFHQDTATLATLRVSEPPVGPEIRAIDQMPVTRERTNRWSIACLEGASVPWHHSRPIAADTKGADCGQPRCRRTTFWRREAIAPATNASRDHRRRIPGPGAAPGKEVMDRSWMLAYLHPSPCCSRLSCRHAHPHSEVPARSATVKPSSPLRLRVVAMVPAPAREEFPGGIEDRGSYATRSLIETEPSEPAFGEFSVPLRTIRQDGVLSPGSRARACPIPFCLWSARPFPSLRQRIPET